MEHKKWRELTHEVGQALLKGPGTHEQLMLLLLLYPMNAFYKLFDEREKRKIARKKVKKLLNNPNTPVPIVEVVNAVINSIRFFTCCHSRGFIKIMAKKVNIFWFKA